MDCEIDLKWGQWHYEAVSVTWGIFVFWYRQIEREMKSESLWSCVTRCWPVMQHDCSPTGITGLHSPVSCKEKKDSYHTLYIFFWVWPQSTAPWQATKLTVFKPSDPTCISVNYTCLHLLNLFSRDSATKLKLDWCVLLSFYYVSSQP